ncbi:hypothetical protein RIR_jg1517.t1 [Rhizophagus irregularis DAOM 181602=DAOM 197198]|nr:hypothetical protein RIR_jg1517.t1 [Rhizophagus irregularis DAOM 181602=DAOM 197198]
MARVQTISTFFMESRWYICNIATKDISGRQGISKDEYTNKENHTTTLWFKKLERSSNLVLYKHFKHDLKRKDYMLKVLELEVDQLRNKAKFIRIKRLYHENTMMLGNLLDQRLDTRHRKVI